MYSLFAAVEATGVPQHSLVRVLDTRTDPTVDLTLEVSADAPLVYLERLRMAGEVPLALDFAWLPADVAEPLLQADLTHTALYIELETDVGCGCPEDVRTSPLWCPNVPTQSCLASPHAAPRWQFVGSPTWGSAPSNCATSSFEAIASPSARDSH